MNNVDINLLRSLMSLMQENGCFELAVDGICIKLNSHNNREDQTPSQEALSTAEIDDSNSVFDDSDFFNSVPEYVRFRNK